MIIDPSIPPELQLPPPISDTTDQPPKMDDAPKSDSVIIDPPIPPELQLPAPISDRRDEDDAPKSDASVTIDPPPFHQSYNYRLPLVIERMNLQKVMFIRVQLWVLLL